MDHNHHGVIISDNVSLSGACARSRSLARSRALSQSCLLTGALSLARTLSLFRSPSLPLALSRSCSLTLTVSLFLCLSPSLPPSLPPSPSLSPLSHKHRHQGPPIRKGNAVARRCTLALNRYTPEHIRTMYIYRHMYMAYACALSVSLIPCSVRHGIPFSDIHTHTQSRSLSLARARSLSLIGPFCADNRCSPARTHTRKDNSCTQPPILKTVRTVRK